MLSDDEMQRQEALVEAASRHVSEAAERPCEICGRVVSGLSLHHDHDHITGRYRGWLCVDCNLGLGRFKDSPALLAKAIGYLAQATRPTTTTDGLIEYTYA